MPVAVWSQAAHTGQWLALSREEDWMLVLTDEQPPDDQKFSVHRWGDDQIQIRGPNSKVRGGVPSLTGGVPTVLARAL